MDMFLAKASYGKQASFRGIVKVTFFASCASFLQGISLFKLAPKCSAEVLSSVRKHKKAVMYLVEKIHVSDKLCSGMSC